MKRVRFLFVPSLSGCLLVASLLSSCTGMYGPTVVPSTEDLQTEVPDQEPLVPSRVQVGVASWYGRGFHGRPTASGEIYNMYQPTAAHRTVALGTQALVTNMHTGESVRVRINDRGPFKHNRVLDLSYEAARQIGLVRAGSGRVKIEFLPADTSQPQPVRFAKSLPVVPEPAPVVAASPLRAVQPLPVATEHTSSVPILQTPGAQPYVVQAGAFHYQPNAHRAQQTLTAVHPRVWIAVTPENAQPLHRVQLGPFPNRHDAERVVHAVKSRGYTALIIPMTQ